MHRWFRYVAAGVLALFVFFGITGALYQTVYAARDRSANPMPGQLVDIGGYRLHIYCAGQGSPTVIFDAGLGDSYMSWRKVQPQIARLTKVCSYDRAGLGYSDSSPRARTSKTIAEELHMLLRSAAIPAPYVLVGHSMGGFDVRLYASAYRGDVAGLVLVDSSHPEQQKRLPAAVNDLDAGWVREQEFFELAMPFGIPRVLGFCGEDAEVRAAECNFHSVRESVKELKSVSESAAQAATAGSLGDIPLAVLSSDPDRPQLDLPEDLVKPTNDAWQQLQNELAQLSTRSTHTIVRNSGHYIQLDQPGAVIEAIKKVVKQVREAQPITAPQR
jgi:pimeloyl-ACP methyl ester carboxylesterase